MQSLHAMEASPWQIVPKWPPVACSLYPRGRQSHTRWIKSMEICMRLAVTRIQFSCDLRPLVTIFMRLVANLVTRQEASEQEAFLVVFTPLLFFYHCQAHIPDPMLPISLRSLDIWFGKCAGTINNRATRKPILHALAASCVQCKADSFFII